MCGTVIRTEVDDIYDSGREEGTKDMVLRMFDHGETMEKICIYAEKSEETVTNWLREAGKIQ